MIPVDDGAAQDQGDPLARRHPVLGRLAGGDPAGARRRSPRCCASGITCAPDAPDDFNIRSPEDILQAQEETSRTFTVLLLAIASVSLLVGGIGIMNIMFVTVTERTREIGVRMAVGATKKNVQAQFLMEALVLSSLSGTAGAVVGVVASVVFSRALLPGRRSSRPSGSSSPSSSPRSSASSSGSTRRARPRCSTPSKRCATSSRLLQVSQRRARRRPAAPAPMTQRSFTFRNARAQKADNPTTTAKRFRPPAGHEGRGRRSRRRERG